MKSFHLFLWIVSLFAVLMGCESDEVVVSDPGYAYFPLRKGLFQIYEVERTQYVLGNPNTVTYQLKTVVVDSFLNAEQTYTYVMHRSMRYTELENWKYIDSWSIRSGDTETVLQIENLPVVNMNYPVKQGLTWDGNKYNTLGKNMYSIVSVNVAEILGMLTFDDCLTVQQEDNDDYIVFLDQRKEIYARNIGLVYKDSTALHYCNQPECLGEEQVEEGVIYKQTILSYGVE